MNCANCGGALTLEDSRRFLICRYCGTFNFPEPADADGISVVGRIPDAPMCPVCNAPLAAAVMDGKPLHFCERCRGVLLPRPSFMAIVHHRRASASDPPAPPRPLDRQALERVLVCPSCGGRFETYPHYGPGNVVIDNCGRCDLIWLDFGEIRTIVEAPGRDRGGPQVRPAAETRPPAPLQPWPEDERSRPDLLTYLLDRLLR